MKNARTLAILVFLATSVFAAENTNVIEGVRRFVPKVRLASEHLSAAVLAGHYVQAGPEVQRRAGPALTGSDLYLFSDGSYLATEWGCLLRETISDRGSWSYVTGRVDLASDHSVSKRDTLRERRFVVLEYTAGEENGYRLMGAEEDFRYFLAHASAGDDFMLLLCSRVQVERLDPNAGADRKKTLLRDAWNPDFFK